MEKNLVHWYLPDSLLSQLATQIQLFNVGYPSAYTLVTGQNIVQFFPSPADDSRRLYLCIWPSPSPLLQRYVHLHNTKPSIIFNLMFLKETLYCIYIKLVNKKLSFFISEEEGEDKSQICCFTGYLVGITAGVLFIIVVPLGWYQIHQNIVSLGCFKELSFSTYRKY